MIIGFEPREKPGEEFYDTMKEMRAIGNNLNQIARKAHSLNFIDEPLYRKEAEKWNQFMLKVKKSISKLYTVKKSPLRPNGRSPAFAVPQAIV